MKPKTALLLSVLFCALPNSAPAGQAPAEIDATMVKIYKASPGRSKGMTHRRSISQGTDWSTVTFESSCALIEPLVLKCEVKTGDDTATVTWRYKDGKEYQESADTKGQTVTRTFEITGAWFSDDRNFGQESSFTGQGADGTEYEVIENVLQMGDRQVVLGKARKTDSGDDYQYTLYVSGQRVE